MKLFDVPNNGLSPSFDDTFSVGFWKWLFAKRPERMEWMRRRNIALKKLQRQRLQNIGDSHASRVEAFKQAQRNLREERAAKKQQSPKPD